MREMRQVTEKRVKGLDVVIYESLIDKAFQYDFNSLMFDSGEIFIEVSGEKGHLLLETNGHVTIIDTKENVKICDEKRFRNKELMKVIENEDIYGSKRYEIDESNWFSVVFFKEDSSDRLVSIDDVVLEYIPSSLDELVDDMIELYDYFTEKQ